MSDDPDRHTKDRGMPDWLDGWTNTRYLNQQTLAKRWANRGTVVADEPQIIPIEHSKYILTHGKKAYRAWVAMGCPDREPRLVCPVMTMVAEFFVRKRYGVWVSHQSDSSLSQSLT